MDYWTQAGAESLKADGNKWKSVTDLATEKHIQK